MKILYFFLMTVVLALPAMAQTALTLDGWRQFKFGMTPEQVQTFPPLGQPWNSIEIPNTPGMSNLTSLGPVKEFGADFDVISLVFSTDKGLKVILLHSERKVPAEVCKKSYLTLLPAVEARYGSFAPLGSGHSLGSIASVQDIPGAKSHYRLVDFTNGSETMMAVRTFGERNVSVRAVHVGDACSIDVLFRQPKPNPPAPPSPKRP